MEKNLKVRFKQRTDTAANWAAKNPVLLQGEFGCESDTGNLKFGDGTKAWNDLSYVKEKLAKVATSGSYNDLSNKPTIPTVPGSLKNPYALTFTGAVTGSYDGSAAKSVAIPVVDSALSSASTNAIQNKAVNTALAGKANKATTLAGYGIADAKITNGVITIGSNTITPLTSHQSLAAYAKTTDVNTALAKKADKATALTNQDLNNVKTDGDYYAGGDNTITNKPSGVDAFGLTVYHTAGGYITQDLVEGNKNPQKRYTRQFDTQNWSAWIVMPTFTANPSSGQVLIADGTLGGIKTSGYTIASSVPVNAKFTDTNTWRGVQNNLTSDSTTESLSAAQGKALKTLVDGKAAKATTLSGYGITDAKINNGVITLGSSTITPLTSHQSLANYYTKSSVDTLISNLKAGLVNVVESLPTAGENGKLYLVKTGTEDKNLYTEYVYVNSAWEKLGTQKLDLSGYLTKTDASSTYLGKTAAAASANKLNTNAGSATQPVYFANGVPVATTYTLGKSVPSNAVFTDTNNKVTQTAVTDADYTNYRPLIWGASNSGTKGFTPTTVTDSLFASTGLYVQPSSGLIHATTFEGNLSGTASNASKVNNLTVQTAVPANAKFTDTVYTHPATHAASMITGLATVATSGSYADLSNKPTIPTSLPANGGTATNATKLATARTISLGTGVTSTATSFDGSSNITIPVTSVSEAYLKWGGKNFAGDFGCIDATMVPDLGANRLAFGKAAGIKVEYSTDDGSTWADYGLTDAQKVGLFGAGSAATIGKASASTLTTKCMLRVTVDTDAFGVYTVLNKFVIYLSTNGCSGTYCTIEAALEETPTTFKVFADKISVSGWSGYNVINTPTIITYGNTKNSQYGLIRFTFGCTAVNTSYSGLTILRIMGFGGIGWSTPSNMAKYGHLYSYDNSQNANFPAQVTATQFNGKLNGTATNATNDSFGNNIRNTYISNLSVSGQTITYTKGDGTTNTITTQDTNTTYKNFTGSNPATGGLAGLVPAPPRTGTNLFLASSGDWTTLPINGIAASNANLTLTNNVLSLSKDNVIGALGYTPVSSVVVRSLIPSMILAASDTSYENEAANDNCVYLNQITGSDNVRSSLVVVGTGGTKVYSNNSGVLLIESSNTTYDAATSSTLGLVKIGSNITVSSGIISLTKANVTAALGYTPPTTNTTYSNMTAATASAAGKAGLVPAPSAGAQTKFLRGDGTWQNVDTSSSKVKMVVY